MRAPALFLTAACLLLPACAASGPRTVAERSGYTRTSTSAEVEAFLADLAERSDRVRLGSIGTTTEGRDIPLAVVADPPVETAEEARADGRMVVLLFGNIHAGEVCGKEALPMLARELALSPDRGALEGLIVCFVPNFNPDGNDRFAPDNRPGQVGLEAMGTRANAQGLDLNRDWTKLDAPETRALVRFMDEWDPAVVVDTHTTNGSLHRYTLTYQGPKHPATDPELLRYVRDGMLPRLDGAFEAGTGWNAFFYGNFTSDHRRWVTYPAGPRYGAAYRGLRNRVSILTEAYAYAPYKDRVLATLAFCRAILEDAAAHKASIERLVESADRRVARAAGEPVALRAEARPFPGRVVALGYAPGETVGGEHRAYEVELVNDFVATYSVDRPAAYVVRANQSEAIERLRAHRIELTILPSDRRLEGETLRVESFERADEPYEGRRRVTVTDLSAEPDAIEAHAGDALVRTDQPLGNLACCLLEPMATDGLLAWGFFDPALDRGGALPVYRVRGSLD